jgi:serine/threonine protein kinase
MQDQTVAAHLGQGEAIGDYEIISVAGSGGMGVVYKATQRSLGRVVALKVIRDEIARVPEYRSRFLREARLAASVNHPNIVSVYDVGERDGRLYLVMQWIDGQDLKRLLDRSVPLSPERAVSIALQLAGAIDAVHIAGLIHRDIKPGNALIRQIGGGDHAYLTDFGVAKPAETSDQLTQTGWMVGTTGYISPEQIRGERPGPRSDLYALGCLFFEALTGTPPFHGENEMALRWAHANDPRPVPSVVAPRLGDHFDAFFATALAVSPSERFFSGREFASALTAADGVPDVFDVTPATEVSSPTPAAPDVATPPPTPTPAPQTPVVMAPPTPPGMYPAYGYVTPVPAPRPARSTSPLALVLLGLVALAGIAAGALAATGAFSHKASTITSSRVVTGATTPGTNTAPSVSAPGGQPGASTVTSPAVATPAQATSSCGGDLSVGARTTCGFAENVEQAYDATSGGPQTVDAYSPATGVTYTINCTGGTPHVCTGGTTNDSSLSFNSGPVAGAPASSAPALTVPPGTSTTGIHACRGSVSGNGVTSCSFAENVFGGYAEAYQSNGAQPVKSVTAYSPVTKKTYTLACETNGVTVNCTGAKGALVSFSMAAVRNR